MIKDVSSNRFTREFEDIYEEMRIGYMLDTEPNAKRCQREVL